MSGMFKLAVVGSVLLVASAVSPDSTAFPLYWNVGESDPQTVDFSKFGYVALNETQTGNSCPPPCKPWSQGVFPRMNVDGKVEANGGVPQAANLTLHLLALEEQIKTWIPDPDAAINAVLDFETFSPIWEQNTSPDTWHSKVYQTYSIALVQKAHPELNHTTAVAMAKDQFQTAAIRFFVATLNKLHELRPNSRWGFYGLPLGFTSPCSQSASGEWECGYDFPGSAGDALRQQTEIEFPIFNASSALYPSVYVPDSSIHVDSWFRSITAETVRLAHQCHHSPPVLPFAWHMYHNGTAILDDADFHSTLYTSYEAGADGLVFWGDGRQLANPAFQDWFTTNGGPVTEAFKEEVTACAKKMCGEHGRCASLVNKDGGCVCFKGWTGPACDTPIPGV